MDRPVKRDATLDSSLSIGRTLPTVSSVMPILVMPEAI
jgi:hypothetical protein